MSGIIREAEIRDIDAIYQLLKIESVKGTVLERSKKEIKSVIDCFFVYEKEGIVKGCVSCEIYGKRMAEIRSLVIDQSERGKGVGKELVKNCLTRIEDKKIEQYFVTTNQTRFFKQFGFSVEQKGKFIMFKKK